MSTTFWLVLFGALPLVAFYFWSLHSTSRAAGRALVILADGRERSSLALREVIGGSTYAGLAYLVEQGHIARRVEPGGRERAGYPQSFYTITDIGRVFVRGQSGKKKA